jgi:hypothetical protein
VSGNPLPTTNLKITPARNHGQKACNQQTSQLGQIANQKRKNKKISQKIFLGPTGSSSLAGRKA